MIRSVRSVAPSGYAHKRATAWNHFADLRSDQAIALEIPVAWINKCHGDFTQTIAPTAPLTGQVLESY